MSTHPEPVGAAEFAAAMDRLGPWDAGRRVAVAVSGGPDSLALALLARGWGDPVAFVVDHGLRPEAPAEAGHAAASLRAAGLPATVLTLTGLRPGPGMPARARQARYVALAAACRGAGLVDLLLGHHAGDQAETVLLRRRAGSGPAGLAGMAAAVARTDVRLLRPLLAFPPGRLAAVVRAAGLVPAQDPTNTDARFTRARLRQELEREPALLPALLAEAAQRGRERAADEAAAAAELAARVRFFPGGFAVLSPGPVGAGALACVLRAVSGRPYAVAGVRALAACPRAATLGGAQLLPAGRLGPGWLVVREAAAVAPPVLAAPGAVWDGRFRVKRLSGVEGCTVGALGAEAARLRSLSAWPAAVLETLPAFRRNGTLSAVPHLSYAGARDDAGATGPEVVQSLVVPECAVACGIVFWGC